MKFLYKITLIVTLVICAFWSQCPVGVNQNYCLSSIAYSYSSITNLKIVNGYACSDNSWIYTISNGLISTTDYTVISKFDGQFSTIWYKTMTGPVQQESFQVTSDENYIILAPNQLLSWTLVKLNTVDGSFSLQQSLTLVTQWQSVQLSSDNTSIFLVGYSTNPVLIQLNLSDLTVVSIKTHTSLQIVSIYFYSSSMLLVNSINLLNTNYQISAVDIIKDTSYAFNNTLLYELKFRNTFMGKHIWMNLHLKYSYHSDPFFNLDFNKSGISIACWRRKTCILCCKS